MERTRIEDIVVSCAWYPNLSQYTIFYSVELWLIAEAEITEIVGINMKHKRSLEWI